MASKHILIVPGDGIGQEVTAAGKKVLDRIAVKFNHTFTYDEALIGHAAIEVTGNPLPDESLEKMKQSDAVLFAPPADFFAVLGFFYAERAGVVQPRGKGPGEGRGHMLGNENGRREIFRQGGENFLHRRRAAGGNADGHDIALGRSGRNSQPGDFLSGGKGCGPRHVRRRRGGGRS